MKKVIVSLSVVMFVFAASVSAQIAAPTPEASTITLEECLISGITLKEGSNSMLVKTGKGTLTFVKTGDRFSNVVFTDASGKATRLAPASGSTGNLPKTECKYPLPDACFGTADKSIGMCICKPTDISAGTYNVSLLLPAVQAAREAARRSN